MSLQPDGDHHDVGVVHGHDVVDQLSTTVGPPIARTSQETGKPRLRQCNAVWPAIHFKVVDPKTSCGAVLSKTKRKRESDVAS
ncbi:MAG: hypothetical protein R2709_14465 [Marmoricola sp.]